MSDGSVGYAIADRLAADLVGWELRTAIAGPQRKGVVIVHADRGAYIRARGIHCVIRAASLKGSMGRVPFAGDNAAMAMFWVLLKRNDMDSQTWRRSEDPHYTVVH